MSGNRGSGHRKKRGRLPITAVLALASLLGGCFKLGPDFIAPEIKTAENWLDKDNTTLKRGDFRQWWKIFKDPALDNVIDTAYRQNPGLQAAAVRIMEARAQLGIAKGKLFPQTQQLGSSLSHNQLSGNSPNLTNFDRIYTAFDMGFDALWEVDLWGKFRRGVEAADANLEASLLDYDDVLVSLTAEAASGYTQIRAFEQRLALARDNVEIQQRSLRIAEAQYRNGISTELDVQQAKALLHGTRAGVLLGNRPAPIEKRPQHPARPAARPSGRPAGQQRRHPQRAAGRGGGHPRRSGPPPAGRAPRRIQSGGAKRHDRRHPSRPVPALFPARQHRPAGRLHPGRGRLRRLRRPRHGGQDRPHRHLADPALRPLEEQRAGAGRPLPRAADRLPERRLESLARGGGRHGGLPQTREQVADLQQGVEASRRAVDISLAQYREGIEDYNRVLNAQQFLVQQQDRLTSSQGDVARHLIAMYKALGGGWELREGREIVPEDIRRAMAERTDWGGMLDEEAEAPPPQP